jgi:hypothetical protein
MEDLKDSAKCGAHTDTATSDQPCQLPASFSHTST